MRLGGRVETGRRLVGYGQRRIASQRQGDDHAQPETARELVGIGVDAPGRIGDAHPRQQSGRSITAAFARPAVVRPDGLAQLVADGERRVQRRPGVLQRQPDLAPAHPVKLLLREP